ncbi:hypothetical protein F2981_21670 (plasmid) [Sinorhizobium meliloti]|nr:hypothetical protein [Sinorhizobium meliloti]
MRDNKRRQSAFSDRGNIPLPDERRRLQHDKIAERAAAEVGPLPSRWSSDDVRAISASKLVGRPRPAAPSL